MTEVFASGILFGFAAAWTHMLLTIEWEKHKRRKADDHARAVELVQAQLDLAAQKIREEYTCTD